MTEEDLTTVCMSCYGADVTQEVTMDIDPNNPPPVILIGSCTFKDAYWCSRCDRDTSVINIPTQNVT